MFHPHFKHSRYIVVAGACFCNLNMNQIVTEKLSVYTRGKAKYKQRVVITKIFSGSVLDRSRSSEELKILDSINDVKIGTIEELIDEITKPFTSISITTKNKSKFVTLREKTIEDDMNTFEKFELNKEKYILR
jgi:hypothetical protein